MSDNKLKTPSDLANENQQKASDPRFSVWVEASAGTGKTKVLTDRVFRLLLSGVNPSKILCLTYTKAAASVMRERIAGKLSRWAVVSDEELEKDLTDVCGVLPSDRKEKNELCLTARKLFATFLDSSDDIKIQTIHSFCQEILKRFPLEAKISPYFEVMDERKSTEILNKIKADILSDEQDVKTASAVGYLVGKVSESSFPKILLKITENRTKIAEFLQKYASFDELKNRLHNNLEVDGNKTEEDLKEECVGGIDKGFLQKAANIFSHSKRDTDLKKCEYFKKLYEQELTTDIFDEYALKFLTGNGEIRKKDLYCKDSLEYDSNIAVMMTDEAKRIREYKQKINRLNIYMSTIAVLQIAGILIDKYNRYKRKVSQMDYEDLIVLTKKLLSDKEVADWVMYKLDEGIEHILVDEAQDNSLYQWDIIKSLSEEFFAGEGANHKKRTVFAVGDRKQSIYSFQGADPQKFESMREYFSQKSDNFKTIRLDVSFRSAPAVLNIVNTVFKFEKAKKGVIPEGQDVEHLAYNSNWGGAVEIWNIKEPEKSDKNAEPELDDFDYSRPTKEGVFAKILVQKIKQTVEENTYIFSKKRPAMYKDFMVLVRSRTGRFLGEFLHECQKENVPTEGADQINLLEQIAVQDLISLGKFLLLPTDDLSLAEVLKSPLFGLDDDDLIKLCAKRKSASLWGSLSDHEEYSEIYAKLQSLINMLDYVRPYELYSHILGRFGGREKFISRMGTEVEDCLDEFINLTISYEEDHIPSLQGFIEWILSDDVKIKRELEQSENDAVKIMTVHGSKGLQAPIVILPDASSVTVKKHGMELLFDDLVYVPLSSKNYVEQCENIYQKEQEKELEEYRRLLYVAITRAEDRIVVCGYRKSEKTYDDSWYKYCFDGIKSLGKENNDGFCYFEDGKIKEELSEKSQNKPKYEYFLPDYPWLNEDAKQEDALAKPYRPSKDDADEEEKGISPIKENEEYKYKRGTLIHKILQFIPNVSSSDKKEKIREFLRKNAPEMRENTVENIVNEVLNLVENKEFSALFGNNSKAEVAIMGEVEGKIISAQIDRLVVCEDKVMIVDYKTNRPAADNLNEVPEIYMKQMLAYTKLLQKIYQNKRVEAYILWTNTASLMKII